MPFMRNVPASINTNQLEIICKPAKLEHASMSATVEKTLPYEPSV
jgi:hypothetical protein